FDLRIQGHAKEPRLVRIDAPITVQGHWRSPSIGVDASDIAGQGGIAAALVSFVAPIAGLLPFVDLGLAEDANCAALLAGRRETPREG
ncbi:MAG: AsmA family protein, partial [Terricaulis sp.]